MNLNCEALVSTDDMTVEEALHGPLTATCENLGTLKHGGCWFCDFHYQLFFEPEKA